MATLMIHRLSLVSLVFLIGIGAEAGVEEFKVLKDDVFSIGYKRFWEEDIEQKINNMLKLVEAGDIPAEVQGNQTLEYLRSLTDDCKSVECNLDEDLERIKRLSERRTGATNLRKYLNLCKTRIYRRCELDAYKRAKDKLSSVDEETMKVVDVFAKQSYYESHFRKVGNFLHKLNPDTPNDETVLKTIKVLDPAGVKAVLKRWTNKETALTEIMNKVRQSCIKFMDNVDPSVKMFDPEYLGQVEGYWDASNWHYYQIRCKKIVDNWDKILKSAFKSYRNHLA